MLQNLGDIGWCDNFYLVAPSHDHDQKLNIFNGHILDMCQNYVFEIGVLYVRDNFPRGQLITENNLHHMPKKMVH